MNETAHLPYHDVGGVVVLCGEQIERPVPIARQARDDGLVCVVVTDDVADVIGALRAADVLEGCYVCHREVPGAVATPADADNWPMRCASTSAHGLALAFWQLSALGIGPGLVVVVGAERRHVAAAGGGRASVVPVDQLPAVLEARRRGRAHGRLPGFDEDPQWTIAFDGPPRSRDVAAVVESVTTLANGDIGTRGVAEDDGEGTPMVVAPGVFDERGDTPSLLQGPSWTSLVMWQAHDVTDRRVLDMRTGMLFRERRPRGLSPAEEERRAVRTLRLVPLERGPSGVMLAEGPMSAIAPGLTLHLPSDHAFASTHREGGAHEAVVAHDHGGIAAYGDTVEQQHDGMRTLERVVGFAVDAERRPTIAEARGAHTALRADGVDALIAAHRAAWARRWQDAAISIEGDAQLERSARFALFHLLSSTSDAGEAAVGPRGLTGIAYGGHVLWDADVYVLPALAATFPRGARAMLEYRLRRLAKARSIAIALGYAGARFPWESGRDGSDITPKLVRRSGHIIPILTGWREEHVVADVAWAACHYADWTGDTAFLEGPGGNLVVECARYWADRIRIDARGQAHIYGVVGPDEYHEIVDDNAYTNVMARWNLRRAADLVAHQSRVDPNEAHQWREIADALNDGYDASRGMHEQFPGFWDLDCSLIAKLSTRPIMADEEFGRLQVKASQIIKQPDVLLLHHLVPEDLPPGSLARDLAYYDPLTAHGSSLSPPIHASLLARAGRPDEALKMFSIATRLDLDDLTHTTGRGLHLATMGGVWQALAYGFMGIRPRGDILSIEPALPTAWDSISLTVRFRGARVSLRATRNTIDVKCERPIRIAVSGASPIVVESSDRVVTIDHEAPARLQPEVLLETVTPVPASAQVRSAS